MESPRGSRVYRALLRLLPQRFRFLYSEEMEEPFLEALEARRKVGGMAWHGTWIRATADVGLLDLRLRFSADRGRRRTPLTGGLTISFLVGLLGTAVGLLGALWATASSLASSSGSGPGTPSGTEPWPSQPWWCAGWDRTHRPDASPAWIP